MKLTLIFLIACFVQVSATVYSQNTKFTFDVKNKRVVEILREIEDQSDFRFFYQREQVDVERKTDLNITDKTVEYILTKLFEGKGIEFDVREDKLILLKPVGTDLKKLDPWIQTHQQRIISGKVTDERNQPLPGVTVLVKGTTHGTVTNVDGEYTLTNVPDDAIIIFSFVGMETREINLEADNIYNVTLSQSAINLDEVVVIGYGTAIRRDLTGSVSRVESGSIRELAPTQLTETLAGTVAGLYSVQSSSAAGGGSLEIRGPSSLTASTSPLIVVDGAIFHGSISEINPADIESMDILKDASSAAVYGSKAAAGVIIVTTKRGEIGKPTINFSARGGVSVTTHDIYPYGLDPDGDPEDYLTMHRDVLRQNFPTRPYYYFFKPEDLPGDISIDEWMNYSANPASNPMDEWMGRINMYPIEIENYKAGKITNFYKEIINPGIRQDYNLSAGGATENLNYYWSIGYLDNEGIVTGDKFNTIRSRVNIDLKVTEWLNVGTNTQFALRDHTAVPASVGGLGLMSPYGSIWNEDGKLRKYPNDYSLVGNPLANYYEQDQYYKINTLFANLFAQFELPFGFNYRISFNPTFSFTKQYNFWSDYISGVGGKGERNDSSLSEWMLDNLLKWNKEFNIHKFDLTLLASAETNYSWWSTHYNSQFAPSENLIFHALQFGALPGLKDNDEKSTGDALMARLNYTLLDKYLFTGSIRRDGYSAFGQKNPHATFPALAFAWKISEESFLNISWLSRLKLRLSWGINGNREIGKYSALAQLGSELGWNTEGLESGVYNTTLANPNLMWEETESYNIGLDMGLLNNRIDISIDAYDATTYNLLLNRQLPAITGFTNIMSNLGKLGNKGIESTINTVNINTNNLNWRSQLVFSLNRNKIIELWGDYGNYRLLGEDHTGELPDFQNRYFPGYSRDIIWDYDVTGVWQLDKTEEAAAYKLVPGDYKAVDVIEDNNYRQLDDKKFIGYRTPQYRIGLKNDFTFLKNFTASVFIRADMNYLAPMGFLTGDQSTYDRRNVWGLGYWSPENPTNDYQRYAFPNNLSKYEGGITIYKPNGFVRVQDISLSYNLPSTAARYLLLNSMRIFANIRNLFTFTNYPGFDPESGMAPMPKTFTLGVDLSL